MRWIASEQIVDDAHALAIAQQTFSDMRADEAGGAGDDIGLRHEGSSFVGWQPIVDARLNCADRVSYNEFRSGRDAWPEWKDCEMAA